MKKTVCPECNGTGKVERYGFISAWMGRCYRCYGRGFLISGVITKDDEKEIGKLPSL